LTQAVGIARTLMAHTIDEQAGRAVDRALDAALEVSVDPGPGGGIRQVRPEEPDVQDESLREPP
jgi:hypothetical protein